MSSLEAVRGGGGSYTCGFGEFGSLALDSGRGGVGTGVAAGADGTDSVLAAGSASSNAALILARSTCEIGFRGARSDWDFLVSMTLSRIQVNKKTMAHPVVTRLKKLAVLVPKIDCGVPPKTPQLKPCPRPA